MYNVRLLEDRCIVCLSRLDSNQKGFFQVTVLKVMDGERLRSCVGGKIIVSIMQLEHLNSGVKLRFILPKSEQREMYISDESIFPQNRI